jgi:transposase
MSKAHSWEVTDEFWQRVEPLVPLRQRPADRAYVRQSGVGRKPKGARVEFEAIVFVLRTGCQWKALPAKRFGSASAIHARFLQWEKAGFSKPYAKPGWPIGQCARWERAPASHKYARRDADACTARESCD